MVGPKAPAWPAVSAAQEALVAGLPVPHGPPVVAPSLAWLERALWRELREARNARTESPHAVHAREEDAPNAAVPGLGRHHHTIAPHPGAVTDPEWQGAPLTPTSLVPAAAPGRSWLWGVSPDWAGDVPVGAPASQDEAAPPEVGPPPPELHRDATDAGVIPPEGAGLAAVFLPENMAVLEQAVRRFLGDLGAAGRDLTRVLSDSVWAHWAVIGAAAALTAELGRRRVQRASRSGGAEEDEAATLSWPASTCPFRPDDTI
jgi:hypothetical protein